MSMKVMGIMSIQKKRGSKKKKKKKIEIEGREKLAQFILKNGCFAIDRCIWTV